MVKIEKTGIKREYINFILNILKNAFKHEKCRAYLFGSRTIGTFTNSSDIDIAIDAKEPAEYEISVVRDSCEDGKIPFKVDVVDLLYAESLLKEDVYQYGVLLWKN